MILIPNSKFSIQSDDTFGYDGAANEAIIQAGRGFRAIYRFKGFSFRHEESEKCFKDK